ncbi:hypothetical protein [Nocardia heshunensis]
MISRNNSRKFQRIIGTVAIAAALAVPSVAAASAASPGAPNHDGYYTCDRYYTSNGQCAHWTYRWQTRWVCVSWYQNGNCARMNTQTY